MRRLLLGLWMAGMVASIGRGTTIADTLYYADGRRANGTLAISWPAFTAISGRTIAQGTNNVPVQNGVFSIELEVPRTVGVQFTVRYELRNGTPTVEYWSIPASGVWKISDVRAVRIPAMATPQAFYADAETPVGAIDGNNLDFALLQNPMPAGSLELTNNGLVQRLGIDYSLAGNTISFTIASAPQAGAILQAWYRFQFMPGIYAGMTIVRGPFTWGGLGEFTWDDI